MFVLKVDLPTGVAYFTGKKRIVQDTESPGLTSEIGEAKFYDDPITAKKFCKMLISRYHMNFYYSFIDE